MPHRNRRELDPADLGREVYLWLNSVVVPRPIAWVSTVSAAGTPNLAPHSYFSVASVRPPVVQFSSTGRKDTLRNVEATGEFVVHLVPFALRELANATATDYPAEEDEMVAVGLTAQPSRRVRPPRVAESPVALECRLAGTYDFGHSVVVFGEVVHLAVAEDVIREGRPRVDLLDPVARLGGDEWCRVGEVFELPRTAYADLNPPPR